ncbi:hypothetical protein Tco_0951192 [Tanacetum coccineum]|uniref:Uncharacterized protein n=1 Tax=Tanacetum coccineum TaxID=301880 RepID=A0ABQ5DTJ2_9ASTR
MGVDEVKRSLRYGDQVRTNEDADVDRFKEVVVLLFTLRTWCQQDLSKFFMSFITFQIVDPFMKELLVYMGRTVNDSSGVSKPSWGEYVYFDTYVSGHLPGGCIYTTSLKQVETKKIQAGVQVSRLEDKDVIFSFEAPWMSFYFVVFVLVRNIIEDGEKKIENHSIDIQDRLSRALLRSWLKTLSDHNTRLRSSTTLKYQLQVVSLRIQGSSSVLSFYECAHELPTTRSPALGIDFSCFVTQLRAGNRLLITIDIAKQRFVLSLSSSDAPFETESETWTFHICGVLDRSTIVICFYGLVLAKLEQKTQLTRPIWKGKDKKKNRLKQTRQEYLKLKEEVDKRTQEKTHDTHIKKTSTEMLSVFLNFIIYIVISTKSFIVSTTVSVFPHSDVDYFEGLSHCVMDHLNSGQISDIMEDEVSLKSYLFAELTDKKDANISEIGIETRPNLKYYGGAASEDVCFLHDLAYIPESQANCRGVTKHHLLEHLLHI